MDILTEIFANKRLEVEQQKQTRQLLEVCSLAEQARPALDFVAALRQASQHGIYHSPALIAEIKHASPSHGVLLPDFDPLKLACLYVENGAAAISVLTDQRYFQGRLSDLSQVAAELEQNSPTGHRIPLLRKDFIYDTYQIYESRAAGADAVLLITAALEPDQLCELHTLTIQLGMAPLVEVHNPEDVEKALCCKPVLMGINNRDLHEFSVDLDNTLRLIPLIPGPTCLVSESGIHTPEEVERLSEAGVDAILVGEALVKAADIAAQVRLLARL